MREINRITLDSFMINSEAEPHIYSHVHTEKYHDGYSNKDFYYVSMAWSGGKVSDEFTANLMRLPLREYRKIISNKWAYTSISTGDDLIFLKLEHAQIALEQLISYFMLNKLIGE